MKTSLSRFSLACALLVTFSQATFGVVTFTNTPAAVSNTFNGVLTLQIAGVPAGSTVLVQKYLDANTNDIIDGGDFLVQQFNLTDGTNFVIGGVTNLNVPGDLNATAGAITAQLNFTPPAQNGDVAQCFVGKYRFRLSSPTGAFTPITNSFAVTNFPFPQAINGMVRSNTVGVPNAVVLAFQAGGGHDLSLQGGTVADNAGNYSLKLPVGSYTLAAFRSNFLANLSAAPTFTLNASSTITTNLFLTNATQSISGKIADASNVALGLPGVGLPVTDTNNFLSFSTSDTNGNYTVRTRPGIWKLGGDSGSLAIHGYLGMQNKLQTNTAGGNVSGLNLLFPKATAMFYGSVKDNLNNPLPGVLLFSQDQSSFLYEDDAVTGLNGNYFSSALAGDWSLYVDNNNPLYSNYVFSSGTQVTLVSNQAVQVNFTAILGTHHITGTVRDSDNNPIAGVQVVAGANIGGTDYSPLDAKTDAGGNYSLTVPDANWSVFVSCNGDNSLDDVLGNGNYVCPNNQNVNVAGGDATYNIVVQLCGGVSITTTSPLPSGQNGSSYDVTLQAVSCFPGYTWLQTAGSLPGGLIFETTGELHGTPTTNGSFNFTAQVTDNSSHVTNRPFALVITTNSVPPPPVSIAGAGGQVVVFYPTTGSNYVLQTTTNAATGPWVPATNGVSVIALTFSNTAPVQFFRLQ